MNAADVVAYTADADILCPECAEKVYGKVALGICPDCGRYLWEANPGKMRCDYCAEDFDKVTDNEGNDVHPIFADNMEESLGDYGCGQCHVLFFQRTECLLDGARGIYIPQAFAQQWGDEIEKQFDKETLDILLEGPDHEQFDDAWYDVEQDIIIEFDNQKWSLYQDDDLFAICTSQDYLYERTWP